MSGLESTSQKDISKKTSVVHAESKSAGSQVGFFKPPKDTQLKSIDFLATADLVNTAAVNKEFRELTFDSLSDEAVLYKTILRGQKCLKERAGDTHTKKNLMMLKTKNGLIALGEDLINGYLSVLTIDKLRVLLTDQGLVLLREGLIQNRFSVLTADKLQALLTNHALTALREGLIQNRFSVLTADKLQALLTDNGLTALRENLIQSHLSSLNPARLNVLLTNNGLIALREGLIDDLHLPLDRLQQALTDEALEAARAARVADAPRVVR